MWHFCQNLSNYMMFEVLEDAWSRLLVALDAASDMDAIIAAHDKYLESILAKSLLTPDLAARVAMRFKVNAVFGSERKTV